jgi:hypothetical protein
MQPEPARRITAEREQCPVHGFRFVVFSLTEGTWVCTSPGPHWPTALGGTVTDAMRETMRRFGIAEETP